MKYRADLDRFLARLFFSFISFSILISIKFEVYWSSIDLYKLQIKFLMAWQLKQRIIWRIPPFSNFFRIGDFTHWWNETPLIDPCARGYASSTHCSVLIIQRPYSLSNIILVRPSSLHLTWHDRGFDWGFVIYT